MCDAIGWAFSTEGCIKEAANNAITDMADAVMDGVGEALTTLGTLWMTVKTPSLVGDRAEDYSPAELSAGNARFLTQETVPLTPDEVSMAPLTTVAGYVMWIALAIAVLSLIALGALIAIRQRSGEGVAAAGRTGIVLGSVVLISGASALISALLPTAQPRAAGAVLFLQSSLWWYTGLAAIISVMIGGARMAWHQRAEPGRELVKSLLTLVVIAGAGTTIVNLLISAGDSVAVWLINRSLECDVNNGSCFKDSMAELLTISSVDDPTLEVKVILVILMGTLALIASIAQVALMIARIGVLVILVGVLPLAAAATNTEMGHQWFRKCIAWIVAFILYKPVAAIVYATAFQLIGTSTIGNDKLLQLIAGLMLMLLAVLALPAMMRLVTPMVGSMGGSTSGGMSGAVVAAALPTGAALVGRLGSGRPGSEEPAGAGKSTDGPSGGGHGAQNSQRGIGRGSATAGGSAAAAGGTAAGGTTAAGAGAGAGSAGPVGIAASASIKAGRAAGRAATSHARRFSEEVADEPDGSR